MSLPGGYTPAKCKNKSWKPLKSVTLMSAYFKLLGGLTSRYNRTGRFPNLDAILRKRVTRYAE